MGSENQCGEGLILFPTHLSHVNFSPAFGLPSCDESECFNTVDSDPIDPDSIKSIVKMNPD